MQLGALALLNGWGDPLDLVSQDPLRAEVGAAMVTEADRLAQKRWQQRADYEAVKTSGLTARRLLKGLSKMLKGGKKKG
ncbi:MAG: hypothetical protein EOP01_00540 [Propionibacteriaceae bacterium]|nr:MAG: hypothetical protein EOP01_00540 [Propionibacteriaceae bacterium]